MAERYQNATFQRDATESKGEPIDLLGCGHRLFDVALRSLERREEALACIPDLDHPHFVFLLRDAITLEKGGPRRAVAALRWEAGAWTLLRDWELIGALNPLLERGLMPSAVHTPAALWPPTLAEQAEAEMARRLPQLELPFLEPREELAVALLPGRR